MSRLIVVYLRFRIEAREFELKLRIDSFLFDQLKLSLDLGFLLLKYNHCLLKAANY